MVAAVRRQVLHVHGADLVVHQRLVDPGDATEDTERAHRLQRERRSPGLTQGVDRVGQADASKVLELRPELRAVEVASLVAAVTLAQPDAFAAMSTARTPATTYTRPFANHPARPSLTISG